jgi:hypothetical protein
MGQDLIGRAAALPVNGWPRHARPGPEKPGLISHSSD